MTDLQVAILISVAAAVGVALVGLVARRHTRVCRAFVSYLAVVFVFDIALAGWPSRWWTWEGWLWRHTILDVLKIAVALELAYWVFLGFPGAAKSVRATVFLLLLGTLAAVLVLPADVARDKDGFLLGSFRPRMEMASAWLFTATAGLVRWYRVPLHPIHRAIILGFVPYLVVFSSVMKLIIDYGWSRYIAMADPWAYLAAACWWAWSAWQSEPPVDVEPALMERLWPWRVRA